MFWSSRYLTFGFTLTVAIFLLFLVGCAQKVEEAVESITVLTDLTPLDEYIQRDDPVYRFEVAHSLKGDGWTYYVLDLVSQTWRSPDEVDRTEWQHWLRVIVPDNVQHDTALLMIGGGRNGSDLNENPDDESLQLALFSNSVVADLGQIPNQPLQFPDLDRPVFEDDLIAYTWDKYLRTGDADWLARLPMTKGVVRAMDAIQEFCVNIDEQDINISSFMVFGGSKRGWTTWTTAAVDPRVRAIAPVVINLLNLVPSFEHHWSVYGFWAPAVKDYVEHNIMNWMGSPEFDSMLEIVEPYEYRHRFTMPKYLIYATGDQFFVPDSTQFYWNELPGPKYLRYIPNADHSLRGSDANISIMVFYQALLNGTTLPELQWTFPSPNTIRAETTQMPREALLWTATNPETRDFRLDVVGPIWGSTPIEDIGSNMYEATVDTPEDGWTAFMIELTYDLPNIPYPLKLTTPVQVIPEETPYTYVPPENPMSGFLSGSPDS